MVSLKYFGLSYWMNYDGTTCYFWYGPEAKGRVIIPDYVEGNGKRYKVTAFGESFEATMRQQPSDKRIKDISKFPKVEIGGKSPFVRNDSDATDFEKALPPNTTVTYVKMPDTVVRLYHGAFRRCYALEEVILSKNITVIPDQAFSGCRALKSIQLHEGITEIGHNAFLGCSAMKEITIPSTVKKIGSAAFGDSNQNKNGLTVVNILNDEGEVLMHPDSFTDRVKIKYLGKPKAAKKTAKVETPQAAPKPAKAEAPKPAAKPAAAAPAAPAGNFKKSASAKGYVIGILPDSKVVVTKGGAPCDNAKGALREVAEAVGFTIDAKWNTQQLGSKLVDFINGK